MATIIGTPQAILTAVRILVLSPIFVLIITAVRLILIGNYDTTTALSIASVGGVVGVLVGTTIPLLPPYLPVVAIAFALFQKWSLFVIAVAATAVISPAYSEALPALRETWQQSRNIFDRVLQYDWSGIWYSARTPAIMFLAGAGLASYYFFSLTKKAFFGAALYNLLVGLAVAVVVAPMPIFVQKVYQVPFDYRVLSEVVRRPWLPAEEIGLLSGSTRLGYTLSTKDGWHLILNEQDRTVEYLPTREIASRRVCTLRQFDYRQPVIALEGATAPTARICTVPSTRSAT